MHHFLLLLFYHTVFRNTLLFKEILQTHIHGSAPIATADARFYQEQYGEIEYFGS